MKKISMALLAGELVEGWLKRQELEGKVVAEEVTDLI